ncbi:proline racemase family protein [Buchananella hordeovulneris]|uniref:proline racemase family protein n=1 Tax=Buchananella hordeovulneris TaxID=52770 RepID=UPI000F5F39CB|nr:proline racemase family protein [Buchananella hordeovulneris]RRD43871.1 proline racemase [Buchananella hordeovulneris]
MTPLGGVALHAAENTPRVLRTIDTHTAGGPTRVLVGGFPPVRGETMALRRADLSRRLDHLRTAVMLEPRGHRDMFGALVMEPTLPEADLGVIFMDGGGYLNMCGHGTIGTVTAALHSGLVRSQGNLTKVVLDTPAGLVHTEAHAVGGVVREVSFVNVPSFVYATAVHVEVAGKKVEVDIAFGGSFFALVRASELGVQVQPSQLPHITELALELRDVINAEVTVRHPQLPHINRVDLVEIYEEPHAIGADCCNVVVFGAGQVDRSPCGTGTCARLALLHAQGQLRTGDSFVHESVIGTRLRGEILAETAVGEHAAIVPRITGAAYVTGFGRLVLDPHDPLRHGFQLA